jgi:glycerol-3-phosphate acyltransferase PlsY
MEIAALYVASYIVGSIPTAYLIGRLAKGVDIRRFGSGNVGGSNVFEHVGKRWVVPMAFSEAVVKGGGPIWAGMYLLDLERSSALLIGAPLLALAGNNWSPFLRMQGGRGIAVTAGALLAFSPPLLAIAAFIAIGGWALTKSSGIWVLIALALLPVGALFFPGGFSVVWFGGDLPVVWYGLGVLGIVSLKRLSSNWAPLPEGLPRKKVLFNRLVRDRDVDDRTQWVNRMPGATP